jgi:septal ring factor EnvC (AmiA/AmiB activator)
MMKPLSEKRRWPFWQIVLLVVCGAAVAGGLIVEARRAQRMNEERLRLTQAIQKELRAQSNSETAPHKSEMEFAKTTLDIETAEKEVRRAEAELKLSQRTVEELEQLLRDHIEKVRVKNPALADLLEFETRDFGKGVAHGMEGIVPVRSSRMRSKIETANRRLSGPFRMLESELERREDAEESAPRIER